MRISPDRSRLFISEKAGRHGDAAVLLRCSLDNHKNHAAKLEGTVKYRVTAVTYYRPNLFLPVGLSGLNCPFNTLEINLQ
jgi:hypothetical protein